MSARSIRRGVPFIAMLAMAVGSLAVVAARPAAAATGFMGHTGTEFTLNGKAITFVGYNDYRLTNMTGGAVCDSGRSQFGGEPVLTDAQMQALFTHMKTDSGTSVVRTWFFQNYYQSAQSGLGNAWAPFDRVLNDAAAAGVKIVPVLLNNYGACEASSGGYPLSSGFYTSAYNQAGYGYSMSYLNYAKTVAAHYASNTTIAFWQLVNEIAPSDCNSSNESSIATDIANFAQTVGSAVKSVDPNHMVSLGTQGSGQCGTSGTYYSQVHAVSAIDLCEYHDYNEAFHAMPTGNPASSTDTGNGLQARLNQCAALGKPLFVGESGIVANVQSNGSSSGSVNATTLQQRATFFKAKLNAAFAAGVGGYLGWEGIPEASDSSANINDGLYGIGSPLVNGGGQDPTEATFLADAGIPPVQNGGGGVGRTCTAQPPQPAREDFEDGSADGWSVNYGPATVAVSTAQCFSGSHSLAIALTGSGNPGVSDTTNLYGLTPGSVVTYHVWQPSGSSLQVEPYATDGSWTIHYLPAQTLTAGWNTVTWPVPSMSGVNAIGLQVNNGGGSTATLYLDNSTYARSDFEDGGIDGWSVAWNSANLSLSNTTAQAYTGTHSLALLLSGSAYPAARSAGAQPGLTTGVTVYYRVYAPTGAPTLSVEPFATDDSWSQHFGNSVNLVAGWNTVAYPWPISDGGQGVGLQVNNGSGWNGTLYLDSVVW